MSKSNGDIKKWVSEKSAKKNRERENEREMRGRGERENMKEK